MRLLLVLYAEVLAGIITRLIDNNYATKGPQYDNAKFEDLTPGMYTFEIMDTWGCVLRKEQIEVIEPKPITVSVTSANLQVCYGETTGGMLFYVQGGRPPYNVKVVDKVYQYHLS